MIYLFWLVVLIVCGSVSWTDIRTKQIPIRVLQLGALVVFGLQIVQGVWVSALIASVLGFIILCLPSYLSKGRLMGEGDAWVGAWMGIVLGLPLLWVSFYSSVLLGGLVAIILLRLGWKRADRVPFAPILCASLLLTLVWGPAVLSWFRNWF